MKHVLSLCLLLSVQWSSALVNADETSAKGKIKPAAKVRTNTVIPVFRLSGPITEKPVAEDMPSFFGGATGESLRSLLSRLEKARNDKDVPAIVLQLNNPIVGRAQLEEVNRKLTALKEAGKKIHVHTDLFTTGQFALIAQATELSMVPTGYMFITGLYGEQVFLRGLLDKIGVTPDYFTCGDYKSAGEMFMRTAPSDEAAEMSKWLYDGIYDNLLATIATGRNVSVEKAKSWIDEGVFTAERAIKKGIIDVVEHHHEFEARLKKQYGDNLKFDRKYGKKSSSQIDLSSPFGLMNFYAELLSPSTSRRSTKPAVGIVYLDGAIMPGDSGGNPFLADAAAFSDTIRKALDEAAEDDAIKAVVFRVNSPGGSAVASEVILNATKRVAAKKPFIVSMGNVAASGGYYVACGTDTILAEDSTITGSIGVVVGKFSTTGMWDKLGVSFTPIERGKNSALMSSAAVFSDSERAAIHSYMDEVYGVFKGHVTTARGKLLKKPIDELAGGRVYTGKQALELGLVDRIGGLNEAVALAAAKADMDSGYEVRVVPRPKGFMELLMSDLSGPKDDGRHLSLGTDAGMTGSVVDAVLPLLQMLDPARVTAVKHALLQLTVLQTERVSLTMPVMTLSN
ncbi:MAG TPA: signal peptide peptidase SppA [Planctomycetes bacterium]|nr:signal peptide peptidase SppA [Planctomycetota bacterium]